MCGRFTNMLSWSELVRLYRIHDKQPPLNLRPRYNVAPSQDIPIVRPAGDGREVVIARWGLIPVWAKDLKIGYKCINARAETVDTTNAYRSAFKARRCLIPADGFYEWLKLDDGSKQPYRLCLADRQPFAFAGLWERNDGLDVTSCTIVTTEPNEVAGKIHNRMPVILPLEDYDAWLSAETTPAHAKAMLRPYDGDMIAYPVSKDVGTPKNDRPDLVEPIENLS